VRCAEGEAHRIAADLAQRARFPDARVCTIDGLRVDWPDGFGLVRASNTTPVLVLRFEGHTQEAMHRIEGEMLGLLRSVKPDAKIGEAAH
jgi:phosphomannomutase